MVNCAKLFFQKIVHGVKVSSTRTASFKFSKEPKNLTLVFQQKAGNHLLIDECVFLQSVGHHIIYVLNKYHVGIKVVEVGKQCPMACGSEKRPSVTFSEWRIVHADCYGISGCLLL